ncbi:MAG: SpoIIE family protein phosphatase [Kofleriaceae bacterium]
MFAVALIAALIRGDRVMRFGVIGAAVATMSWQVCAGLAACTDDPETGVRLHRLGAGPIALVGPNLLLVLLGVSGQLERYRWLARLAGLAGVSFLALCWATDWVVPAVHPLSSGIMFSSAGPLTAIHVGQLALWLSCGIFIVNRAIAASERVRLVRMIVASVVLGALSASDLLAVYRVWDGFPVSWFAALVAGLLTIYLELYTPLLRPQGIDRGVIIELTSFVVATAIIGVLAILVSGTSVLGFTVLASAAWVIGLAITWSAIAQRPPRIARDRALEEFVAKLADVDDERTVVERLAALWTRIPIGIRATWRLEDGHFVEVTDGRTWQLDGDVATWLVHHGESVAPGDLATMRLGEIRPKLEHVVSGRSATLLVPLLDRGMLVGIVEADHVDALREDERGFVAESARAVARALTYAALARTAAEQRGTAREVELAEAMRVHATASRADEFGPWSVAAEYRTAKRATGAGWSTVLLPDGRLAVLVTEAQAHGVAAALAMAAVTGAFTAATAGPGKVSLEDLLATLHASAEGITRRSEPINAFIALLDLDASTVTWACAGHPGAYVVVPNHRAIDVSYSLVQLGGGTEMTSSFAAATRGEDVLPTDAALVIASTSLRGEDEARWQQTLRQLSRSGSRLAAVLVETAVRDRELNDDFLAVVVRQHATEAL